MNTVCITMDGHWVYRFLKDLFVGADDQWSDYHACYHDVMPESREWLDHLLEATSMYLFWRTRLAARRAGEQELQRITADIIYGQCLTDLNTDVLLRYWDELYLQLSHTLLMVAAQADVRNMHFVNDHQGARVLTVNCVFH